MIKIIKASASKKKSTKRQIYRALGILPIYQDFWLFPIEPFICYFYNEKTNNYVTEFSI